jgi:hypothetical protein
VTLGADVAVTSVVLEKAREVFPKAERVLLGSAKLNELFGGDSTLRVRELQYATAGDLLDRLRSWLPLLGAVDAELSGLHSGEFVLLDPDSRLLQLGLLPALQDESAYFFFESRCYGSDASQSSDHSKSLSELTLDWINEQFGAGPPIVPSVCLREADRTVARELLRKLRQAGPRPVVAVSFGVGGNWYKRLPDPFEHELLRALFKEGCTVLLDKGASAAELEQADSLVNGVRAALGNGAGVAEFTAGNASSAMTPGLSQCRLLTWQGGIGAFSALTAEADQYIGYDSAGQHIAAALGVPTISIFSRIAPQIFRDRWRATGRGLAHQVTELGRDGAPRPTQDVIDEVVRLHRTMRANLSRLSS